MESCSSKYTDSAVETKTEIQIKEDKDDDDDLVFHSKRRKVEPLLKTVLFVCGAVPKKFVVHMERVSRITVTELKKNCREKVAPLPNGYFDVVASNDECQVALFKFRDAVGCRSTNSNQHSKLSLPLSRNKDLVALTQPTVQVGFKYLFGYEQPYTVVDGKPVVSSPVMPLQKLDKDTEISKTRIMIQTMQAKVDTKYIIDDFSNMLGYCPFRGGGDILIVNREQNDDVAAVVQSILENEDPQDPEVDLNITPPQEGEIRGGISENKLKETRTEREILLQLQASMNLIAAHLLYKKVKSDPSSAESIGCITSYGLMMGQTYPLKIIKMSMDFRTSERKYEEQFCLYPCGIYGAYIDLCIEYILKWL